MHGVAQRSLARCQGLTWLHREDHSRHHAGERVSEQHGCRDAPSACPTSRFPDAYREGRHEQSIRDLVERNHEGSHRRPLSRQLTELLISVAVARIPQGPKYVTDDVEHRRDDTADEQDLSYHPAPLLTSGLQYQCATSIMICHDTHWRFQQATYDQVLRPGGYEAYSPNV